MPVGKPSLLASRRIKEKEHVSRGNYTGRQMPDIIMAKGHACLLNVPRYRREERAFIEIPVLRGMTLRAAIIVVGAAVY